MNGWLARTVLLQRQFHPDGLPEVGTDEWRQYVEYNVVALIKELGEFLAEVQTSPWKERVGVLDFRHAVEEYVDMLHFLGNIAVACDITDDILDVAYDQKLQKNYERLINGRSKAVRLNGGDHPAYSRDPITDREIR